MSCTYRAHVAVDDVSLEVQRGSIHALLATNGAANTTLLESIQGFPRPAQGELTVYGRDPWQYRTVLLVVLRIAVIGGDAAIVSPDARDALAWIGELPWGAWMAVAEAWAAIGGGVWLWLMRTIQVC